uniref:RUN and FYVE domain-containing protein 4 n=1 Tax=Oryctolagus cuniculus TaxID=9986 RepID=G1TI48_RABIT
MAEEGSVLKVTRDLKAAVSAILQAYGDSQGPVTDASAELHRLCGCLELLLQFDQKEQKSFLGPRKDYWDFLCTALRRQRGDTEAVCFVGSQNKLKSSLGKGRAFIRFCLAHGQLAESLQLCLLSPELTREWYGPRSPLLCPELQENILDSLYALNGVTFDLDLQRPDLDGAWPMFSESRCSDSHRTQGRRPRKAKNSHKEVPLLCLLSEWLLPLTEPHSSHTSCLRNATRDAPLAGPLRPQQHGHLSPFLEKREDASSLGCPHSTWEPEGEELRPEQGEGAPRTGVSLETSAASSQGQAEGRGVLPGAEGQKATQGTREATSESRQKWGGPGVVRETLGTEEDPTTEKQPEQTGVTSVARREEQADKSLQAVVKSLRHGLQQAQEQARCQEQLLKEREGELRALREQLHREKDLLWQKLQHLSAVAPGCCVGCSKIFGRLSRRYPCRLCGGLVCHACSADYRRRERCCPLCAQGAEAQVP